jgi:hypothetical protein
MFLFMLHGLHWRPKPVHEQPRDQCQPKNPKFKRKEKCPYHFTVKSLIFQWQLNFWG